MGFLAEIAGKKVISGLGTHVSHACGTM